MDNKSKIVNVVGSMLIILTTLNYILTPIAVFYIDLKLWLTFIIIAVAETIDIFSAALGIQLSAFIIMPIAFYRVYSRPDIGFVEVLFYVIFALWVLSVIFRLFALLIDINTKTKQRKEGGDPKQVHFRRSIALKLLLSVVVFIALCALVIVFNMFILEPALPDIVTNPTTSNILISSVASLVAFIIYCIVIYRAISRIWKKKPEDAPQIEAAETTDKEIEEVAEEIVDEEIHEIQTKEIPETQAIELDDEPTAPEIKALEPTRKQLVIPLPNFRKLRLKRKPRISTVILSVLLGVSVIASVMCLVYAANTKRDSIYNAMTVIEQKSEITNLDTDVIKLRRDLAEITSELSQAKTNVMVYEAYICCTTEGDSYYHVFDKCAQLKKGIIKAGGFLLLNIDIAEQALGLKPCPYCH